MGVMGHVSILFSGVWRFEVLARLEVLAEVLLLKTTRYSRGPWTYKVMHGPF